MPKRSLLRTTFLAATLIAGFGETVATCLAQPKAAELATDAGKLKVPAGFKVDLIYSVPKPDQGSWVSLCHDPKGRLIVSDQYGGLFRVTVPKIGSSDAASIEPINVPLGEAQGLLWAFDSLYAVVNGGGKYASGVYRVRDTNNDDQLDSVEMLKAIDGSGEHGPHAVLLCPDGQSLLIVCGNSTKTMPTDFSNVPRHIGEDHLLPRMPDGNGFMKGVLGPGGSMYRISPDGKVWEWQSTGYRNQYDAAYNHAGEIFTYDSDMEWDFNTPWYRPTRVCHSVSGAEFGWRNGAGVWPAHYIDSLPPSVSIGPGSPTGVCFGYGAKFPAKYQESLFICDWSYGKLYAVHLDPQGASYTGKPEEFVTGTPLPLTDLVISPVDGAMYFAIGGRKTQSGLYRVTYTGPESTAPAVVTADKGTAARAIRHKLEAFHGRVDAAAVSTAWPYLGHEDRFIRWAARVAIEHQPLGQWLDRALAENQPAAKLSALLAAARVGGIDPFHRKPEDPPVNAELGAKLLVALGSIPYDQLTVNQKIDLCRIYEVTLNRFGKPDGDALAQILAKFESAYPTDSRELNMGLANLLVYVQSPTVAAKTMELLRQAKTQEDQIDYARPIRVLTVGWTPELRKEYFTWLGKAQSFKGGASFAGFIKLIREDAVATLTEEEKVAFAAEIAEPTAEQVAVPVVAARPFVKEWALPELAAKVAAGIPAGRNYDHGRQIFAATSCFACHRYGTEGGAAGPDLTGVAGRFSPRDLLESIIEPSKSVSDQYAAVTIVKADGTSVTGRIANLNENTLMIQADMLNPGNLTNVARSEIEEMETSKLSMMPTGLLNTLNEAEIYDLLAYVLSRGDSQSALFQPVK